MTRLSSGDPTASAVVIWTRLTPAEGETGIHPVRWTLAADPGFKTIVASGAGEQVRMLGPLLGHTSGCFAVRQERRVRHPADAPQLQKYRAAVAVDLVGH